MWAREIELPVTLARLNVHCHSLTSEVAIVTNHIDAVVLALASASIGAIFSSTATDMGTQVGLLCAFHAVDLAHIGNVLYRASSIDTSRFSPRSSSQKRRLLGWERR